MEVCIWLGCVCRCFQTSWTEMRRHSLSVGSTTPGTRVLVGSITLGTRVLVWAKKEESESRGSHTSCHLCFLIADAMPPPTSHLCSLYPSSLQGLCPHVTSQHISRSVIPGQQGRWCSESHMAAELSGRAHSLLIKAPGLASPSDRTEKVKREALAPECALWTVSF